MAKIDKFKEQIGWLKITFGILVAIDVSIIGWLVENYKTADIILIVVSFTIIVFTTLGIIYVNKKGLEKIDELEDL